MLVRLRSWWNGAGILVSVSLPPSGLFLLSQCHLGKSSISASWHRKSWKPWDLSEPNAKISEVPRFKQGLWTMI
jgi:hypothetical protein